VEKTMKFRYTWIRSGFRSWIRRGTGCWRWCGSIDM